jgi:hypothetical protein
MKVWCSHYEGHLTLLQKVNVSPTFVYWKLSPQSNSVREVGPFGGACRALLSTAMLDGGSSVPFCPSAFHHVKTQQEGPHQTAGWTALILGLPSLQICDKEMSVLHKLSHLRYSVTTKQTSCYMIQQGQF